MGKLYLLLILVCSVVFAEEAYREVLKSALDVQPNYLNMKVSEDENGGTNYLIEIKTKVTEPDQKTVMAKTTLDKVIAEASNEKVNSPDSLFELGDKLDKKTVAAINGNNSSLSYVNADAFHTKYDQKFDEAIEYSEIYLQKLEHQIKLSKLK